MATTQPLNQGDGSVVEEIVDGAYFEQLNTLNNALAFDMGTVGPGVQEEAREAGPCGRSRAGRGPEEVEGGGVLKEWVQESTEEGTDHESEALGCFHDADVF